MLPERDLWNDCGQRGGAGRSDWGFLAFCDHAEKAELKAVAYVDQRVVYARVETGQHPARQSFAGRAVGLWREDVLLDGDSGAFLQDDDMEVLQVRVVVPMRTENGSVWCVRCVSQYARSVSQVLLEVVPRDRSRGPRVRARHGLQRLEDSVVQRGGPTECVYCKYLVGYVAICGQIQLLRGTTGARTHLWKPNSLAKPWRCTWFALRTSVAATVVSYVIPGRRPGHLAEGGEDGRGKSTSRSLSAIAD